MGCERPAHGARREQVRGIVSRASRAVKPATKLQPEEEKKQAMGESYLHRKLFGRSKRMRPQSSVQSSELSGDEQQQQQVAGDEEQRRPPPGEQQLSGQLVRADSDDSAENNQSDRTSGTNSQTPSHRKPARARLKTASRAVLLFRRAASSLTHSSSSVGSGQQPQTGGGQARGRRLASSASASNLLGPAGHCLPRFIVPKLNALKLPIVCQIKSLDGQLMREVFVHRYELGQYLIDSLRVSLDLKDAKYFGLRLAKSLDDQEDVRAPWLDLNESVYKQISRNKFATMTTTTTTTQSTAPKTTSMSGGSNGPSSGQGSSSTAGSATAPKSVELYLRIKFYPPNLARIQDAFLRNYLWLQLRRDLRLGKLTSSMGNLTQLMACVLQYELGDFEPQLVERIPALNILPNQDLVEEQACEVWRSRLTGARRHQAQMQFLRAAVILETYGFDYYPVRDHQRQRAYLLGFNYAGLKAIRNGRIAYHFRWHSLGKISYERRMIIFHIYPTEYSKVSLEEPIGPTLTSDRPTDLAESLTTTTAQADPRLQVPVERGLPEPIHASPGAEVLLHVSGGPTPILGTVPVWQVAN